ncbi:helix-turn-helix domain-containing protein [Aggregatibacter actinomycetemcomitans]
MHSQGKNVAEIARLLGWHRSTITRELKRLPKGH